jgi:hypothetical protein
MELNLNVGADAPEWEVTSDNAELPAGTMITVEPTQDPPKLSLIVLKFDGQYFMGRWRPRKRLDWLDIRSDANGSLKRRLKFRKDNPPKILGIVYVVHEPSKAAPKPWLKLVAMSKTPVPQDRQRGSEDTAPKLRLVPNYAC